MVGGQEGQGQPCRRLGLLRCWFSLGLGNSHGTAATLPNEATPGAGAVREGDGACRVVWGLMCHWPLPHSQLWVRSL